MNHSILIGIDTNGGMTSITPPRQSAETAPTNILL